MNLDDLWESALADIELHVSRPNFVTWFGSSRLVEKDNGVALISLPNNFSKEWIENRYQQVVLGALRNIDDTTRKVEFIVASTKQGGRLKAKETLRARADDRQQSFSELTVDPETNLNPRYTLASFVVGKSNELAYAATQAIIGELGSKYNPLFIYGGVGLGKTHLIEGFGNEVRSHYGGAVKVRYVSSEKFTNDVIWAIKNKRMETIKEKYRLVDVLIIDDIQFLAGKTTTEEEFFHTFNALYERNKQIVISSDRPPKFITTLEDRLRSRFEGGMIVDIGYPDYELRSAIIRTKLEEQRVSTIGDDIVTLIATKIQKNIREVEGVLHKILFHQARGTTPITVKLVEDIISEATQKPMRNLNPNVIIDAVADFYEVSAADLANRSRKKEIAESRQIAMYLLRDILNLSYPHIGRKLGKRDHTTAIYACNKIANEVLRDQSLQHKILTIKEIIQSAAGE